MTAVGSVFFTGLGGGGRIYWPRRRVAGGLPPGLIPWVLLLFHIGRPLPVLIYLALSWRRFRVANYSS